jgi:hypothetical protein
MAEDHINTAFSALGALDIILKRCMEGFAFWQRINNFPESVETFKFRLDLYRAKLAFWAQEWGIETNRHLMDRRFVAYEAAVVNYLKIIHRIIDDLGSLGPINPRPGKFQDLMSMQAWPRLYQLRNPASADFYAAEANSATSRRSGFSPEGLKWELQDEKSRESLALLATLIQDLYDFLPPPFSDPAGAIILSSSLASQDTQTLARVSLALDSAPLQAGLAWLKSIAYRTLATSYTTGVTTSQLDLSTMEPLNREPGDLRFVANYKGSTVFVEKKCSIVPRHEHQQQDTLKSRIENIVLRLQDPRKPAELRTLPCQGIHICTSTGHDAVTLTYSIVYSAEAPRFFSLREIVGQKGKSKREIQQWRECLSLGRRYLIAQILSRAVMYLHLADWLHKAIRSENILFFGNDVASLRTTLPYLVGFEYSRPDAHGERTENIVEKNEDKFYRHPSAQAVPVADFEQPLGGAGRYSKVYDIHSIGVVLVELGLFASARSIVAEHTRSSCDDPTPDDICKVLVEEAIPKLRFRMGDVYANATRICLDGFFDQFDRECLGSEFYRNVVRPLELCNA